jgi:hypothetical protein
MKSARAPGGDWTSPADAASAMYLGSVLIAAAGVGAAVSLQLNRA